MLLRQMRCLVAVIDCKGFSEAAKELSLSQSAVSQQIQLLEKDLGVELLKRDRRSFELTTAGEYFYRRSKKLLKEAKRVRNNTLLLSNQQEKSLNIGYLYKYPCDELTKAIQEFTGKYAGIKMNFISGNHEDLYEGLINGDVDIIISDQRRAFSPEYVNIILKEAPLYIAISRSHYLNRLEKIERKDLDRIPCICIASEAQEETEEEFYTRSMGFKGNKIFVRSMTEAEMAVLGNRGFMPFGKIGTISEKIGLTSRPVYLKGEPMIERCCIFWRKENTNPYKQEFADILMHSFQ